MADRMKLLGPKSPLKMPMLACGCRAAAMGEHGPCCVIHHPDPASWTVVDEPDLENRVARCSHYGRQVDRHARSCILKQCRTGEQCSCEVPSTKPVPFFKYQGPGSRYAQEQCGKCFYVERAHWPLWEVELEVERRWYKHDRHVQKSTREGRAPNRKFAEIWAEGQAKFFRNQQKAETRVFSAEVVRITEIGNLPDHEFEPAGDPGFDEFYCGCIIGWD